MIFQVPPKDHHRSRALSPSSPIDHNLDHLADLAQWEAELALDPACAELTPDSAEVESALVRRLSPGTGPTRQAGALPPARGDPRAGRVRDAGGRHGQRHGDLAVGRPVLPGTSSDASVPAATA